MKFVLVVLLVIFLNTSTAFGHKPIQSDDSNITFQNALEISDHKISWAIYESLEPYNVKFYSFEAKKGDSLFASIVIPKLERLENYKPSLALSGESIQSSSVHDIGTQLPDGGIIVYNYDGNIPSKEFYEPFGQATYWERQEIRVSIPENGLYYLIVFDQQGMSGKYSLAIGTIEDFSVVDFFTILPKAWFETKIFFEDYTSLVIVLSILVIIPSMVLFRKRIRKKTD